MCQCFDTLHNSNGTHFSWWLLASGFICRMLPPGKVCEKLITNTVLILKQDGPTPDNSLPVVFVNYVRHSNQSVYLRCCMISYRQNISGTVSELYPDIKDEVHVYVWDYVMNECIPVHKGMRFVEFYTPSIIVIIETETDRLPCSCDTLPGYSVDDNIANVIPHYFDGMNATQFYSTYSAVFSFTIRYSD